MNVTQAADETREAPRRGRVARRVLNAAIPVTVLVVTVAWLPWILSNTRVLNGLLSSSLAGQEIDASVGGARLGWLTPAALRDIRMEDQQQRWSLEADEASSKLTLWKLIWSGGDFGQFHIKQPVLTVNTDRPWPEPPAEEAADGDVAPLTGAHEQLSVTVEDGRVLVRSRADAEPQEFVRGANLTVEYQQHGDQRTVVILPGKLVQNVQLTKEMCDLGLKFVLPILADVSWVRGSLSLELEHCEIPLGDPRSAHVLGRLNIHSVESGLQASLAREISSVASRFGTQQLPESVELAKDSVVSFRVEDGRVEHENLEFGLPGVAKDLVVSTRGTVGMDKTLDLVATLPPIGDWLGDGLIGQALRADRLRLPIQGTLDEPKISLQGHEPMLEMLVGPLAAPLHNGDLSDEELQQTLKGVGDTVGELLDRMRQRRQERLERTEEDGEPPGLFPRLRERGGANNPPP